VLSLSTPKKIQASLAPFWVWILLLLSLSLACEIQSSSTQKKTSGTLHVEVTDELRLPKFKVDLLLVIDNSASMQKHWLLKRRALEKFIAQMGRDGDRRDGYDIQIGIITTDFDSPNQSGRLQGSPRLLSNRLETTLFKRVFSKMLDQLPKGSPCEQGLAAIKAALSPPLINTHNRGFLRPNSSLNIYILSDEDDCSHPGKNPGSELFSRIFHLPASQLLRGPDGKLLSDVNGKTIPGRMDELTSVESYIHFFRSLNRKLVFSASIGSPFLWYKDEKHRRLMLQKVCKETKQCQIFEPESTYHYSSSTNRHCGGCRLGMTQILPAFRYGQVLSAFSNSQNIQSFCREDTPYSRSAIGWSPPFGEIALSKEPIAHSAIKVQHKKENGPFETIPLASKLQKRCGKEIDCLSSQDAKPSVCGPSNHCYGDGWVYFPAERSRGARIRLSGKALLSLEPGSNIRVSYVIVSK